MSYRYRHKTFYTWAGPTLVALNPLKDVPELYSKEIMKLFAHETFTYINPHIFALGQRALKHLQWGIGKTHQAIVVNGESGAGKVNKIFFFLIYKNLFLIFSLFYRHILLSTFFPT